MANWHHCIMLCRKLSLLIIPLVLFTLVSCRSHSRAEAPAANYDSSASDITQADQFYRQRDDLARLERGMVLVRQAAAIEPGNYDAAWRLAKFDYYLATHTQGDYQERAFREGVDAGK